MNSPHTRDSRRVFSNGVNLSFLASLLLDALFRSLFSAPAIDVEFSIPAHRKIFIAVMTSNRNLPRLTVSYASGLGALDLHPSVDRIRFMGWRPLRGNGSVFHPRYVEVTAIDNDRSVGILCSKFIVAIELFLKTSASWILRICDDTLVNPRTFRDFYDELNSIGDPLTSRIIQGNVIDRADLSYVYLQGGSGFVFSRCAARELYLQQHRFLNFCRCAYADDRAIGRWLQATGVSPRQATNRWIVGHQFSGTDSVADLLRTEALPSCPAAPPHGPARPFFQRVRDIAFWHLHRERWLDIGPRARQIQDSISERVMFYMLGRDPRPCLDSGGTEARFYDL
jgi:hypothetical protein